MVPQDWSLLVIAAPSGKQLQPVQLQKALFLLGENLSAVQLCAKPFYEFAPYDYGPFSSQVYQDADALEVQGLVHIDRPPVTRYKLYSATEEGQKRAQELRALLHPGVVKYLDTVVEFTRRLSFNQLVSAIYQAFPAMKANSVFKD